MDTLIFIGIDPGKTGFVAIVTEHDLVAAEPTPTIKVGKKNEYNVPGMRNILADINEPGRQCHAILEKQQAMPGQGVSSMFSIGQGFGLWEGLLVGLGIPYTIVHPRTWKKEMLRDVPGDDPKGRSILACGRMFPEVSLLRTERCRKPDHNMAEAILLAEYGRRYSG